MIATLNGITFDADKRVGFTLADHDGWDDYPTPRISADMIPGADGAYLPDRTLLEPRVITFTGLLLDSPTASQDAAQFRRIHALGQPQQLVVYDDDGTWDVTVVVKQADLQPIHAGLQSYVLQLVANDPVKWAPTLTSGPVGMPSQVGGLVLPSAFPWDLGTSSREVATVTNDGSVPVLPRMTLVGSADSVTVFGGPRKLEFGAFDGELVFDSLERRAWLNGGEVTRQMIRRDWPVVVPDEISDFYFDAVEPSPTSQLVINYRIGTW